MKCCLDIHAGMFNSLQYNCRSAMGTKAISQNGNADFTTRNTFLMSYSHAIFTSHTCLSLSLSVLCNMLCRLISPMNNKWWTLIGNSPMMPRATDLMDASVLQDPLRSFFHPMPLFCSIHPQLEISISLAVIDWMNHPEQHRHPPTPSHKVSLSPAFALICHALKWALTPRLYFFSSDCVMDVLRAWDKPG